MYLFRRHQTEQAKAILDKSFSSLSTADRRRWNGDFVSRRSDFFDFL